MIIKPNQEILSTEATRDDYLQAVIPRLSILFQLELFVVNETTIRVFKGVVRVHKSACREIFQRIHAAIYSWIL